MREPIVVTGLGVVTPIGIGADAFTRALREGCSGVRRITAFPCAGFDSQIAAEITDGAFDPGDYVEPRKLTKLMSRATRFAVAAAAAARREAGLGADAVAPERLGVSLGIGGMGLVDVELLDHQAAAAVDAIGPGSRPAFNLEAFARAYRRRTNPVSVVVGLPNAAAAHLAIQHGARGPNSSVATACTAGTQAIGDAMRILERGEADVMLAGGADAPVNPVAVLGFSLLGTLSRRNDDPPRASRPFDRDRDGFVLGEGAAVLVLERASFARARGAAIVAEIQGYAATCDAYRITDERPDADGAAGAMRRCLQDAGLTPGDVDYVNAHGTGTPMNDQTETRAIKQVFGPHAATLPVSSTKSMTGHLLAASGGVEAAACILALRHGFIPPTINYETPDPQCDLDCVPNQARPAPIRTALSNSFGFGGQNACLLIRKA